MKFHEDIQNGFEVIELTQVCHRNCYLQSSKRHNSKNIYRSVMVSASPMLVNIYMKLHEDILNGFQVTERTQFCDGQMDRQTTQAKTICLPTLKAGRHINVNYYFYFLYYVRIKISLYSNLSLINAWCCPTDVNINLFQLPSHEIIFRNLLSNT